jgi:hypothetical protein
MIARLARSPRLRSTSLAAALAALLCGCGGGGGGGEPPAADLTGVWIGTYTIGSSSAGAVILELSQSGGSLSGALEIKGAGVEGGNAGVWVTGTISGHAVRLQIRSTSGTVTATEAAGVLTGTVDADGVTASWNATLVETHALAVAESFTSSIPYPDQLAARGSTLWLADGTTINETSAGGAVTAVVDVRCDQGFDRCGDGFICSDGGTLRMVTQAATWQAAALPTSTRAWSLTCDATAIWANTADAVLVDGYAPVRKLDLDGQPTGTLFQIPGIVQGLTFDGTDLRALLFFPRVVLRISTSTGAILSASCVPELTDADWLSGLTWDGSALWTLRYQEATVVPVKLVPTP